MQRTACASALAASLLLAAPALAADATAFLPLQDPNILPVTAEPRQYTIPQPQAATSYVLDNPCTVDIRIKSVPTMADTVTATTGRRFMARTSNSRSSSPLMTAQRIVSVMAVSDPGSAGCAVEFTYGVGQ
ncbi:hypothetical protein VQ02_27500 [Methylobacterium variabile]|jgi:hypothetical protein|uniref:ABC transporter substrate-binding protein n=1 Tax=Methylobacterium variabile TaxID=298794 RepID=A0A0J6SAG9_9HYPH|nr:hypothetical protein [Methylobacterium variabile]KMO30712.1 hypothetical protein VQ02_27500 [Methylobacterium variabile]